MSEVQAWFLTATLLIQTVGFCAAIGTLGALQRRIHNMQFEVTRLARVARGGTRNDGDSIREAVERTSVDSLSSSLLSVEEVEALVEQEYGIADGDQHRAGLLDTADQGVVPAREGRVGEFDGVAEVVADSAHAAEGSEVAS